MNNHKRKSRKGDGRKTALLLVAFVAVVAAIWFFTSREDEKTVAATDFFATETFNVEELRNREVPLIVAFGADSCPSCREMVPFLQQMGRDYEGKATIVYVDVSTYYEIARQFSIIYIPTLLLFDAKGQPYQPQNPEGKNIRFMKDENSGEILYATHTGYLGEAEVKALLLDMGMQE